MLPENVTFDDFKLTAFPLTLEDKAREWLFNLPSGSIHTWEELLKAFNRKFYPTSRISSQRSDILGIRQWENETFHDFWERFYEGMNDKDRRMIDASSGGDIFNKTPQEIRSLFGTISQNQRNFGTRNEMKRNSPQVVGEVSNTQHLESKLLDLTNVLSQMVVGSGQQLMVCGICAMTGHYTDKCPTLGSEPEDQNPPNILMRPQHPQYPSQKPPYPQTYFNPPNYQQPPPQGQSSGNHQMSLQELVTSLAQIQSQFQQETKNIFSNIQAQIGDLATTLNKMEQRGRLSSQTEKNPNVSTITLKSGKTLGESTPKRVSREEEDEVIIVEPSKVVPPKEPVVPNIGQPESSNNTIKPLVIPPPFPSRLAFSKKIEEENELFVTFRKVQINIPLLNAIKQIPSYAKFLKDLCTKKRKFKANEKIQVNANVSAVIQKKLPPKCKDPRIFAIPCTIGDLHVERETGVIIQLANKSSVSPRGVLEDVLVQVNQLVFLADFYVIDLEEKTPSKSSMILLGRPFMHTAHTIIDVHKGKITMEFDGETIHFNIFQAMRYPSNISPLYRVDVIEAINGIIPNVFIDKILMEDDCKPKREAQRRLNHPMMEVIKKKIIKRFKRCKEKKKAFHDKYKTQKHFIPGKKVILYHSRLKLFPGKLQSRWHEPFIVIKVFDHSAVEIKSLETNQIFKVNGHHLKPFYEGFDMGEFDNITLETPIYEG
ncbi:uncharacterized protein LOC111886000 [Lactuca sativa]|uniref:uncharacterized protein LOC111886000 n=1 Tax=Lactuca sativa TaxID=4236 RepID=UPI0022AE9DCF|nr:uncharacterized protein LOC111886000 [Lactuca sativa]